MTAFETLQHFSGSYLATLAIAGVCAYLGLFTVLRRIVFTGVALAQMAAAGVAAAFYLADHPALPSWLTQAAARSGATVGSLGVAVAGAVGLEARGRAGASRLSPDALVGLAYAASSALAILLVWRSARGLAELRNILAGEVLLAGQEERLTLFVGLAAVAGVHLIYRRRFLLISYDPEFARAIGLPERRLNLLLTVTLAAAVALSLRAGGLLLVFAFLVFPALTGLTLGRRLGEATRLALAAAAAASLAGFLAAIRADLPVAPTVACCLLAELALAGLGARLPRAAPGLRAALYAAGAAAVLAGAVAAVTAPGPQASDPAAPQHADPHAPHVAAQESATALPLAEWVRRLAEGHTAARRAEAARRLQERADPAALLPLVGALGDTEPAVREAAAAALARLAAQPGVRERLRAAARGEAPERRVHAALALLRVGEREGARALIDALGDAAVPLFVRDQALGRLRALAGGADHGYDPFAAPTANRQALLRWDRWWRDTGCKLRWDAGSQRFTR